MTLFAGEFFIRFFIILFGSVGILGALNSFGSVRGIFSVRVLLFVLAMLDVQCAVGAPIPSMLGGTILLARPLLGSTV